MNYKFEMQLLANERDDALHKLRDSETRATQMEVRAEAAESIAADARVSAATAVGIIADERRLRYAAESACTALRQRVEELEGAIIAAINQDHGSYGSVIHALRAALLSAVPASSPYEAVWCADCQRVTTREPCRADGHRFDPIAPASPAPQPAPATAQPITECKRCFGAHMIRDAFNAGPCPCDCHAPPATAAVCPGCDGYGGESKADGRVWINCRVCRDGKRYEHAAPADTGKGEGR